MPIVSPSSQTDCGVRGRMASSAAFAREPASVWDTFRRNGSDER